MAVRTNGRAQARAEWRGSCRLFDPPPQGRDGGDARPDPSKLAHLSPPGTACAAAACPERCPWRTLRRRRIGGAVMARRQVCTVFRSFARIDRRPRTASRRPGSPRLRSAIRRPKGYLPAFCGIRLAASEPGYRARAGTIASRRLLARPPSLKTFPAPRRCRLAASPGLPPTVSLASVPSAILARRGAMAMDHASISCCPALRPWFQARRTGCRCGSGPCRTQRAGDWCRAGNTRSRNIPAGRSVRAC